MPIYRGAEGKVALYQANNIVNQGVRGVNTLIQEGFPPADPGKESYYTRCLLAGIHTWSLTYQQDFKNLAIPAKQYTPPDYTKYIVDRDNDRLEFSPESSILCKTPFGSLGNAILELHAYYDDLDNPFAVQSLRYWYPNGRWLIKVLPYDNIEFEDPKEKQWGDAKIISFCILQQLNIVSNVRNIVNLHLVFACEYLHILL